MPSLPSVKSPDAKKRVTIIDKPLPTTTATTARLGSSQSSPTLPAPAATAGSARRSSLLKPSKEKVEEDDCKLSLAIPLPQPLIPSPVKESVALSNPSPTKFSKVNLIEEIDDESLPKLFHTEIKNFWTIRRGLHVSIWKHSLHNCLEIVATDSIKSYMAPSNGNIYIDLDKLTTIVTAAASTAPREYISSSSSMYSARSSPRRPPSSKGPQILSTKALMIRYLMERLTMKLTSPQVINKSKDIDSDEIGYFSDFRIFLSTMLGDEVTVLNDGSTELAIICPKPKQLRSTLNTPSNDPIPGIARWKYIPENDNDDASTASSSSDEEEENDDFVVTKKQSSHVHKKTNLSTTAAPMLPTMAIGSVSTTTSLSREWNDEEDDDEVRSLSSSFQSSPFSSSSSSSKSSKLPPVITSNNTNNTQNSSNNKNMSRQLSKS